MTLSKTSGQPTERLSIIRGPADPSLLQRTFNDILSERCAHHPDHIAVSSQHQNTSLTYGELHRQSEELARGLYALGVRPGDRVGVLLGNRYEYAIIMFACSKLGAYFTLFNYAYTQTELMNALHATTPKVLFLTLTTSRFDYTSIANNLNDSVSSLQKMIVLRDTSRQTEFLATSKAFVTYEKLMALGSQSNVDVEKIANQVTPHDILNLQFTSGSTGLPKTAALTHRGMVNGARYIGLQMKTKPTDIINVPVPLFHAFGLIMGLCVATVYGGSIVLPSEYFDVSATLEAVEKYKCTGLYGVTTMFVDMLSHPRFVETRRSSLRFGMMAGSAMPDGLLTRVMTKFPIQDMYTNWGMTELSSVATMTTAEDPVNKKLRSAGKLLPNLIGKMVDPETMQIVPWGQRGEIVVSGWGVMNSYYGQPERTHQAIREHPQDLECPELGRDENGNLRKWMHTGDEGYLDQDGYFVITGRIKDLIIRGGENISPNEIEARLFQHPAIKQCSVFGVPSARYGEEVAAILEFDQSHQALRPSDDEIKKWVRMELSRYKVPVYIWWLGDKDAGLPDEWPKTTNGKLRKPDIKKIGEELLKKSASPSKTEIRSSL